MQLQGKNESEGGVCERFLGEGRCSNPAMPNWWREKRTWPPERVGVPMLVASRPTKHPALTAKAARLLARAKKEAALKTADRAEASKRAD